MIHTKRKIYPLSIYFALLVQLFVCTTATSALAATASTGVVSQSTATPVVPPGNSAPEGTSGANSPQENSSFADFAASLSADSSRSLPQAAPTARSTLRALMNPNISVIGNIAAAIGEGSNAVETFVSAHDPSTNAFTLQQVELAIQSSVAPYFEYNVNAVFFLYEMELEEAYATTSALPAGLQLRFGQMLYAAGRENRNHLHRQTLSRASLIKTALLGEDGLRSIGIEGSWLVPTPFYQNISFSFGAEPEASGRIGTVGPWLARQLYLGRDEVSFELGENTVLLWGIWGSTSGASPLRTDLAGTDLYLKFQPRLNNPDHRYLALTLEAAARRIRSPQSDVPDVAAYALIDGRFASRWMASVRYDLLRPENRGRQWHRLGTALSWRPTEFSRFNLEPWLTHAPDSTVDGPWGWSLVLASEISIGAHSAHSF